MSHASEDKMEIARPLAEALMVIAQRYRTTVAVGSLTKSHFSWKSTVEANEPSLLRLARALQRISSGTAELRMLDGDNIMTHLQAPDLLADRFSRYFQHPDPNHDYLIIGDRAVACSNLRDAFEWLHVTDARGASAKTPELFDKKLETLVKNFQSEWHHPIVDGKVGPNTRARIVRAIIDRFGPNVFGRLRKNEDDQVPTVFVSYAWCDASKVDKVDQWLRNHGIRVMRDREVFVAGTSLDENIRSAVARADKIIVFYSEHSRSRDWPHVERAIAEQVEQRTSTRLLIYVRLDGSPLPSNDPTRLAINAKDVPLRVIGQQILHAVTGASIPPPTIVIEEDQPL